MPYVTKYSRDNRRRPYRKYPSRNRRFKKAYRRTAISRPVATQVPNAIRLKLRFNDDVAINGTSVGGASAGFSLNSLYDPDISLGGGVISMFEQWAAIYKKYIVYGAKVTATCFVTSNNSGGLTVGMAGLAAGAAVPSSVAEYADWITETKGAVFKPIPLYTSGQDYPVARFSKYYSIKRLNGERLEEDEYGADVTTDPTKESVCYLVAGYHNSTGTFVTRWTIRVTYYCKLYQPQLGATAV